MSTRQVIGHNHTCNRCNAKGKSTSRPGQRVVAKPEGWHWVKSKHPPYQQLVCDECHRTRYWEPITTEEMDKCNICGQPTEHLEICRVCLKEVCENCYLPMPGEIVCEDHPGQYKLDGSIVMCQAHFPLRG